jgi:hypothetical protein
VLFRQEGASFSPISFPIPLASALGSSEVHVVSLEEQNKENGKEPPAECLGTVSEPKAAKGTLCVYEGEAFLEAPKTSEIHAYNICTPTHNYANCARGATKNGAVMAIAFLNGGKVEEEGALQGSWAVTAP